MCRVVVQESYLSHRIIDRFPRMLNIKLKLVLLAPGAKVLG